MPRSKAQRQRGFTLIELILVITILGIISVSVAQVISLSAQIYITGAERTRLVSDARFIILRLEKELRNIVPNSVSFDASLGCLTYYPIVMSGTYTADPFDDDLHSVVFKMKAPASGDKLVIYPTSPQSVIDNSVDYNGYTAATDNEGNVLDHQYIIELGAVNTQSSPGKRFFVFNINPVSVCKETTAQGEALVRRDGVSTGIIATNVSSWSADVITVSLRQNALVKLDLTLIGNDDESLAFSHEVHFPNVP
ncbi:type II secretion system protein J [Alteromonas macleodii]|uniref:PulJ/GspJ family protein n=1 Tax=Alteromonas macleodii TaxID=28108 RepID=UPI003659F2C3